MKAKPFNRHLQMRDEKGNIVYVHKHLKSLLEKRGWRIKSVRHDIDEKVTEVTCINGNKEIFGRSYCHPQDMFNKRVGLTLALRRVMDVSRNIS